MSSALHGEAIIVTGGASGLGEATARLLHGDGASVAIFDRSEPDHMPAERAMFVEVDVTDSDSVAKAVEKVVEKFGTLTGVVNAAGVGVAGLTVGRDGEPLDVSTFDFVLKVNLLGTFLVSSVAAAAMAKLPERAGGRGRGVLVNVASVAGIEGQKGQVPYSASKGGVIGMTLPMARDLARHKIRVMCIAPGIIDTPMMAAASKRVRDNLLASVTYPPRFGKPDEFALLVKQLVQNDYLNGETIRFDGGIRFSNL